MRFEWFMAVVEVALHRSFLDGPVHALDLPVGPGMVGLGEPVVDVVGLAGAVEGMSTEACGWALTVFRQVGELDAVAAPESKLSGDPGCR